MSTRDNGHAPELIRRPSSDDAEGAKLRERAIRRIALFLETSVETVEANLPGSLLTILCRLPENTQLRRSQDHIILREMQLLFDEIESDDVRRPRLKFLLEAATVRRRK